MKFLKSFAIQIIAAALAAFLFVNVARPSTSADTLRVTTWNLQWFPNGSAKRATPEKQAATIDAAAEVLKEIDPDVMLLQEIRDRDACERLIVALAPAKYEILVCSQFREGMGNAVGLQQVAILAKTSADGAWAEAWKTKGLIDPPRGYAFAVIPFGGQQVGFYSVHLKSNLVRKNPEQENQLNLLKRETSAEQLIAHSRAMAKDYPRMAGVIIGGDLNTNRDQELFAKEKTLQLLTDAGFADPVGELPFDLRITHPGKGRYPDATFDYLFVRGLKPAALPMIRETKASDHAPVTIDFKLRPGK